MKKRVIAIITLVMLLLGSSVAGYAYWDQLKQNTSGQFDIGYGVRLEVPTKVQDQRALVPAGSFYAAYQADYTTSYVFQYTLNLQDALQSGMTADLKVDISNFLVNSTSALFNNDASVFTITVGTDEADASASTTGVWNFSDAFYTDHNTVVVTVTITLADNGNTSFDSTDYNFVSGQTANFGIGFELSNSSSSTAPETPLQ